MRQPLALLLVSKAHEEARWAPIAEAYRKLLSSLGVEVRGPISDPGRLPEAVDAPSLLLVHLTGGTSKVAYYAALRAKSTVVLIAYGENNSLPSALSAKARIEKVGIPVRLIFTTKPAGRAPIEAEIEAIRAAESVRSMRVALFCEPRKTPEAEAFERRFGAEVVPIPEHKVLAELSEVRDEELVPAAERAGIEGACGELRETLRLAVALSRLVKKYGCNAATADCFRMITRLGITPCIGFALLNAEGYPTACEEDYRSLVLLKLAREISGRSGWIANPSSLEDGRLVFAHCTAAFDILESWTLPEHFETGRPAAVAGVFKHRQALAACLDRDYRRLYVFKVTIERSGMLVENRCRTQAVLAADLGDDPLSELKGNHHVLIFGSPQALLPKLRRVCFHLGIEVVELDRAGR